MKTKTLKIKFESWENFKDRSKKELKEVIKTRTGRVQPNNELIFETVKSYQQLMSEQKYVILAAIRNLKPTSLYQLAKQVDRDFANVKKDCEVLEASGFIILKDVGDNRKTKSPQLVFDYSAIEIYLPKMVYSHSLGKIAA